MPVFLENRLLRKLAANNNVWANSTPDSDLNVDSTHPMFAIDEDRSFEWHLSPQSEGIGALIMDSPRTIESLALLRELRTALQPQEYQVEDLASTPNKHHLDWYIKNSGNNKVDEIWKALNAGEYLEELPATIGTGTIEAPEIPALHKLDYYIKNTNSTKLNDVWKALDAGKYSINDLDPTKPLIPNLGFLIKNTARVLGLRLDANGNVDRALEKAQYLPATLNNPTLGDKDSEGKFNDYSLSCWGLRGRMMPHLPTAYAAGGKPTALYDVFHDIPQQLEAILRQFDISLGIQHGSEIRLPGLDSKIHAYPNQLAMQQEMLRRTEAIQQATSKIQNIVLVNSQETREIVSGIGFATTQKYLQLRDGSGSKQFLPYFGHQKNMPSIAQRLTTVDINLAIQNGVLMPKKQPDKATVFNPFNLFKPKS